MRIRFTRGFFRLWIAFSTLWIAGVLYNSYQESQAVSVRELVGQANPYDDLIPQYAHCWDYRTEDGKRIQRKDFAPSALLLIARCQQEVDKKAVLYSGVWIALGVPVALLILGLLALWVARGFAAGSNAPS